MRFLVISIICFICICSVWLGYVEYKQHRFNTDFSKQVAEKTNSGSTIETETTELSDLSPPLDIAADKLSTTETDTLTAKEKSASSVSIAVESDPVEKPSWTDIEEKQTEIVVPWEDPNTAGVNYRDMDPEEYAEHWRDKLKEKHGDIPEVDMFIALHLALQKKEPMKLDDHVLFVELLNFFYPGPENAKGLEEIKVYRQEFGGDTLFMPPR